VVVGMTATPSVLDPALATDRNALQALWLVYTPLLTYRRAEGRDGTEPVPGLARSLPEVSDDGLTYTLRLRRGLHYSNGVPVRAGDFERAIERARTLRSPLAALYAGIASVDADARSGTIRVALARRDPAFTRVLALPSSAPLPRGTRAEDLSSRPPPGIGPYRIAGVRAGRRVRLARMRDFRLPGVPAGHVDSITLEGSGSAARQATAVIAGVLDVTEKTAPIDLLPELRSKYRDQYRESTTTSTVALVPNTETFPLDDPAVRLAIGESLDRQKLVRLYGGLLEASCNFLPETVDGYRPLEPCPYGDPDGPPNLVAAERRIDDAGADGARVSLRPSRDVPPAVARYVLRTLNSIDLDATLGGRGASLRIERSAPLIAHPAAFLERFTRAAFDPELSDAVAQGMGTDDDEPWSSADKRVVSEGFAVPLGFERRPVFFSERIDVEDCARVHAVFGLDLSSLCLK
jgi:peptide/nickel transport system substrate-binding protein